MGSSMTSSIERPIRGIEGHIVEPIRISQGFHIPIGIQGRIVAFDNQHVVGTHNHDAHNQH